MNESDLRKILNREKHANKLLESALVQVLDILFRVQCHKNKPKEREFKLLLSNPRIQSAMRKMGNDSQRKFALTGAAMASKIRAISRMQREKLNKENDNA